jgi:hypothetical protein
MFLPKIKIPNTLQQTVMNAAESHYADVPLSAMTIGVISLAINEELISEDDFTLAKKSKKALSALATHCAKSLTALVQSQLIADNYNAMTLTFQTFNDCALDIDGEDTFIGFRLCLDSLLVFNLALKNTAPESLKLLSQQISFKISNQLGFRTSFDLSESTYESEQWEHLISSAKELEIPANFTLYKRLFKNDCIFEDENEFTHFCEKMRYMDKAQEKGGIAHQESPSVENYINALSVDDKKHPLFKKLMAIYNYAQETVYARDFFQQSNIIGFEEETAPLEYGLLSYGGFMGEDEIIAQHVQDLNAVGESIVMPFNPIHKNSLKDAVNYLSKLCSLSKYCDETLLNEVDLVSI